MLVPNHWNGGARHRVDPDVFPPPLVFVYIVKISYGRLSFFFFWAFFCATTWGGVFSFVAVYMQAPLVFNLLLIPYTKRDGQSPSSFSRLVGRFDTAQVLWDLLYGVILLYLFFYLLFS